METRLQGADIIVVDAGFALTASVPPGTNEVMFAYSFPYSGAEATVVRSFLYGAESVRVLAPVDLLEIAVEELGEPEIIRIGERDYWKYDGADMPRRSHISVELLGLPTGSSIDRLRGRLEGVRFEYAAPVGLGILMALAVAFALWKRAPGRPHPAAEGLDDERGRLVEQIAGLDQSLEEGLPDVRHLDELAEHVRYGRHRTVLDAAGNDRVVRGQVGRDVEGETVHGDPACDPDANGRDLAAGRPDARQAVLRVRLNAERRQRVRQRALQRPHVRPGA